MAGRSARRTHVGLALLLAVAAATGPASWLVAGPGAARVVLAVHGAAGLGLLVLGPAKAAVVRAATGRTTAGWSAAALLAVVLATGAAHALGATGPVLGVTAMQVHVGAAVLLAVPLVAHVAAQPLPRRGLAVRRTDLRRRALVRAATTAGLALAAWAVTEGAARATGLPGAGRRGTGSFERGSGEPAAMPVTQWAFDRVPDEVPGRPVVEVRAAGASRRVDLGDLPATEVAAVLDCTGGWWASQEWRGATVAALLEGVPPQAGSAVEVVSTTGYRRRFSRAEADHLLLATHCAGRPLSRGHGAPVRLVVPDQRGFAWVKWVERVEVVGSPAWWQPPLPLG